MQIERIEIRNYRAFHHAVLNDQLGVLDRSMSEFITTLTLENAIASPTNGELFGDGNTGGAT